MQDILQLNQDNPQPILNFILEMKQNFCIILNGNHNMKKFVWLGLFVGSAVGGYVPALWGDGVFSFVSILFSTIGGLLGIWAGHKLGQIGGG